MSNLTKKWPKNKAKLGFSHGGITERGEHSSPLQKKQTQPLARLRFAGEGDAVPAGAFNAVHSLVSGSQKLWRVTSTSGNSGMVGIITNGRGPSAAHGRTSAH